MNMAYNKRVISLILILSILSGCKGCFQTFQKLGDAENNVKQFINHKDVAASIQTSTSQGTNVTITIYNYNIEENSVVNLKRRANSIDSIIIKTVPEWKEVNYRTVEFTASSDPDNKNNVISFKFEGNK